MFETHPLDGPFGVEIVGVDLNEVDDALMRQLAATLYEHRVICIRGQSLSKERYLEFGRQWGEPIPHVLDHMRMPGFPEMMTVGNTEKRDEDPKIRNGAALWHTDQSYEAVPASATMLYSLRAPSSGGETQFCNMAAAYESLPADLRPQADRLNVAHKYGMGIRGPDEPPANPIINDKQDSQVPAVYHPAVMTHPIAGHRALYALGHGAHGAEGMDDDRRCHCSTRFANTPSMTNTCTSTSTKLETLLFGIRSRRCTAQRRSMWRPRMKTHAFYGE